MPHINYNLETVRQYLRINNINPNRFKKHAEIISYINLDVSVIAPVLGKNQNRTEKKQLLKLKMKLS